MTDREAIRAELHYPRNGAGPDSIIVSLLDVRAADNITLRYDFDRDGWAVTQDRTRQAEGHMEVIEHDVEVAFVPAWNTGEVPTDMQKIEAIRALMGDFTNWEPGTPEEYWSITDHMFLDFHFWKKFTAILDGRSQS